MSLAKRASFSRCCSAHSRSSGSNSQCRAVTWMRMAVLFEGWGWSGHPAPEARRQDGELLAVLGHGSPGDPQSFLVQQLGDALVGKRLLLVFLLDQGLDDVLRGPGRD